MAIHLPLLFADGLPTSLERITQNQLEKFIPFMLMCCPEYYTPGRPLWWPSTVPYQIPLKPGNAPQQWLTLLKELVCRCYEYHKCEHVLRFCARLSELPSANIIYKETSSGYVSIYNRINNKLIVTFKKKNQIYDRTMASPFKSLLPRKPSQEPPRDQHIEDIYLCNYCDSEFTSGKDAIAHEAACRGKVDEDAQNTETLDQDVVMRFFGLGPTNSSLNKQGTPASKRGTSVRLTARSYMQIPFSSPLGRKMGANVPKLSIEDEMDYLKKLETYCCGQVANVSSQTKRLRKFRGPFRPYRSRKHQHSWSHKYCFNKAQRKERMLTLRTGLNKHTRFLLKKCKPAIVLLERLALLDPLALHAAASLNFPFVGKDSDSDLIIEKNNVSKGTNSRDVLEMTNINNKPETTRNVKKEDVFPRLNNETTVCIDLTCDTASDDEVSLKENCTCARNSSDIFLNSTSNHKRPPLHDWSSTQAMRQNSESVGASFSAFSSLPTSSLLSIASL